MILRPGGIYGPRDEDSLNLFKVARTGVMPVPTAKGRLQPVYVKDVAEAVIEGDVLRLKWGTKTAKKREIC